MCGLQPLSRSAGEGADPRIAVRGEAGEGSFGFKRWVRCTRWISTTTDVPDKPDPVDRWRATIKALEAIVRLYLLQQAEGSAGAGESLRRYDRHWTPVHLDVVVEDLEAALSRALAAGAGAETEIRTEARGKIVVLADPFGHGICRIEFLGRGYDEIAL